MFLRDAPVADTTDLALRVMAFVPWGRAWINSGPASTSGGATDVLACHSTIWACSPSHEGRSRPSATCSDASGDPAAGRGRRTARRTSTTLPRPSRASLSGVRDRPIQRGLAFIRNHTAANGGVRLVAGWEPDAQSTAWAVQAYLAAGVKPPAAAFRFLASLRRPDGSYRYSRRYAVTPAIVTAQVLPALSRKPFPLR